MEIEWTNLHGFDGRYAIATNGTITDAVRDGALIVPYALGGMAVVRLTNPHNMRSHPVAMDELMVDHFIDPPARPHLYEITHLDGDILNCRLDNYGWKRKWTPQHPSTKGE